MCVCVCVCTHKHAQSGTVGLKQNASCVSNHPINLVFLLPHTYTKKHAQLSAILLCISFTATIDGVRKANKKLSVSR